MDKLTEEQLRKTDEQLRQWNDEMDRLRNWYIRQNRMMKYKLERIIAGQIVYRV